MNNADKTFVKSNTLVFYIETVQSATNAYYKCGDKDAALDLVQDAFKNWENCSQIDFNKVKTYLLTTINNLFLNTIKHNKVVMAFAKRRLI
jgi:RNA polymerase sigma-70 factor (ECF subfamily)